MFSEIPISALNDFEFCPRSLYFHGVYDVFDGMHYKARPQVWGTLKHAASDSGLSSSRKQLLQGMSVASAQYGLVGKIDIYDTETKTLIERKSNIERVHPGYVSQVLGQIACLEEMGYEVREAMLHSLSDNKKYFVEPTASDWDRFLGLLDRIRDFDISTAPISDNEKKCAGCIYRTLCRSECVEL